MLNFRKACVLLLNLTIGGWLVKVNLFDESSDVAGLFTLITLFFLGIYNVYAWVLYRRFSPNHQRLLSTEALFVLLLALPMILLWGMTF